MPLPFILRFCRGVDCRCRLVFCPTSTLRRDSDFLNRAGNGSERKKTKTERQRKARKRQQKSAEAPTNKNDTASTTAARTQLALSSGFFPKRVNVSSSAGPLGFRSCPRPSAQCPRPSAFLFQSGFLSFCRSVVLSFCRFRRFRRSVVPVIPSFRSFRAPAPTLIQPNESPKSSMS